MGQCFSLLKYGINITTPINQTPNMELIEQLKQPKITLYTQYS